jgi:hypothetical protein
MTTRPAFQPLQVRGQRLLASVVDEVVLVSQYGRMRLVLARRIYRGQSRLSTVRKGQSRIRPVWRTSHA